MKARQAGRGLTRKALAGAAIAAVVLGGIYAIAATTATSMASSFATTQTTSHSRSVEFESETMRASAERSAARDKCSQGTRKDRFICDAAVRAREERAVLRSIHQGNSTP